jgi:hypothetical protein
MQSFRGCGITMECVKLCIHRSIFLLIPTNNGATKAHTRADQYPPVYNDEVTFYTNSMSI